MIRKWLVGLASVALISLGGMSAVQAEDKNCGDFETGEEVWEFWDSNGHSKDNDPEGLDRDKDGLPCEELTAGMEEQFLESESSEETVTEEETTEEEVTEENDSEEEAAEESEEETASEEENSEEVAAGAEESSDTGDALPTTATSYPMMILFGAITAGAGALLLFRRKTIQA
ncbi:LPXTG cell wall anchor domain-containing protein [Salipaludibacillus sp. CF4.18]|uniref:LPXTG cell wall anchor domain-containing protein n=1 Tax=Salipaludibacillus sp. CF4.18 TaxID=3373081 RepID=UPI003EE5F7CB